MNSQNVGCASGPSVARLQEPQRCAPLARCNVCPHACALREGARGLCGARVAQGGVVVSESYGRVTSLALDPVEKKPIACWNPGATVLSVGSYGCNMSCPFCQNASIAQDEKAGGHWRVVQPDQLVQAALDAHGQGCIGIAFTYNEPLVGYEFVRDTARLAHQAGLKNVLVSNGMINAEPMHELRGLIDAANIDLKAFDSVTYRRLGGSLECVKATIATLAADPACHVEVTTLVVPGLNDSEEQIDQAAAWIASLDVACGDRQLDGRRIPYHLTRFFPCNRMTDRGPTPIATLERLKQVASRHLDVVLLGNC